MTKITSSSNSTLPIFKDILQILSYINLQVWLFSFFISLTFYITLLLISFWYPASSFKGCVFSLYFNNSYLVLYLSSWKLFLIVSFFYCSFFYLRHILFFYFIMLVSSFQFSFQCVILYFQWFNHCIVIIIFITYFFSICSSCTLIMISFSTILFSFSLHSSLCGFSFSSSYLLVPSFFHSHFLYLLLKLFFYFMELC